MRSAQVPTCRQDRDHDRCKDLWFVSSTPELAVGVFLGYDRPRSLGKSAYGSGHAAPIVRAFLERALADKPRTAFRDLADVSARKAYSPSSSTYFR
jgi:membrane carboxypeptidase/penicillin-binding protein